MQILSLQRGRHQIASLALVCFMKSVGQQSKVLVLVATVGTMFPSFYFLPFHSLRYGASNLGASLPNLVSTCGVLCICDRNSYFHRITCCTFLWSGKYPCSKATLNARCTANIVLDQSSNFCIGEARGKRMLVRRSDRVELINFPARAFDVAGRDT